MDKSRMVELCLMRKQEGVHKMTDCASRRKKRLPEGKESSKENAKAARAAFAIPISEWSGIA